MSRRRSPEAVARHREERAQLTDPASVMEAAASFLAVRPRSVSETRRRLIRQGYPPLLVEQVVAQLTSLEYLDDAEFARQWLESRDRSRPRGEAALRRELIVKGVAREVIDEALANRVQSSEGDADARAARELLERKRGQLEREADPRRRRQKAYALLARHGFDPDTCRATIAEWMAID